MSSTKIPVEDIIHHIQKKWTILGVKIAGKLKSDTIYGSPNGMYGCVVSFSPIQNPNHQILGLTRESLDPEEMQKIFGVESDYLWLKN